MFESISLDITAFLGFVNIKVWAEDNELHYSRDVMTSLEDNTEDSISTMSVDEFSKRLHALGITGWKKHYEPDGVMYLDGVSWKTEYKDSDNKKYKSSGDNEYPMNWKKFLKLLKEVVGDFETYED